MVWIRCAIAAIIASAAVPAAPAEGRLQLQFVAESLPPFVTDEQGKPGGPVAEMVQAACEAIGATCSVELLPWRRAYAQAEKGQVDGLFVLVQTPERESHFYFSEALLQTGYALFARVPTPLRYTGTPDLEGFTLAAYGPSGTSLAAEEVVRKLQHARVEIEVDNASVLRKLAAGRYGEKGAAVINRDVGAWLIQRDHVAGVAAVGMLKDIEYRVGLSRKRLDPAVAQRFLAALHELLRQGRVKAIADKFGLRAPGR